MKNLFRVEIWLPFGRSLPSLSHSIYHSSCLQSCAPKPVVACRIFKHTDECLCPYCVTLGAIAAAARKNPVSRPERIIRKPPVLYNFQPATFHVINLHSFVCVRFQALSAIL